VIKVVQVLHIFLLAGVLCTAASARSLDGLELDPIHRPGSPYPIPSSVANTMEKDGWKLTVIVMRPGTRSQGYHGVLTQNGTEVHGRKGDTLDTPLGRVVHEGSLDEREFLWSSSGWYLSEPILPEEGNASEAQ
jgi:hypothetical protein